MEPCRLRPAAVQHFGRSGGQEDIGKGETKEQEESLESAVPSRTRTEREGFHAEGSDTLSLGIHPALSNHGDLGKWF